MNTNVLVIAAHPDDEVLGCGGSMAKWAQDGLNVHVLIMAEGATSRDRQRDRAMRKETLSILAQSAKHSAKILGIDTIELLDFPDNRMDSVDLIEVVKTIEDRIDKLKPAMVVTHHSGDLNIDHQIIHQAVITACRPQPKQTVKRILAFEVPSSTEWRPSDYGSLFIPNWYEDITDNLSTKMNALEAYQCEMRPWPHARSIRAVEHLARWRGASAGFEAAESFMLIRNIT